MLNTILRDKTENYVGVNEANAIKKKPPPQKV